MKIQSKEIKLVDISKIKPNPKNRNSHSPEQIVRLSQIIEYQGFRDPLIISNRSGLLVSGHGRLEAAKKLGMKKIPCVFQDFKDEDMEYAALVSENSIGAWSELDLSGINTDLADLGPDFNIDMLGIEGFVLEPADKGGNTDEDAIPENVPAKAKLGDLYQLGNHRLLCGDSTDPKQVERLMNGDRADITFTSPPYNLGDNAKLRGYNGDGKDSAYNEKSDHKSQEEYLSFLGLWTSLALKHSKYVFSNIQILAGNKFIMSDYWQSFKSNLVDIMVWDKEHAAPQMAARVLNSVWEFIFIFTDEHEPKRSIKSGPEFRGTVDNIYRLNPVGKKDPLAKDHRAVFPVAFPETFIKQFSDKSALDLFGGSGTTLIACEKTNRKCYMMELDPHYVDVIVKRWEQFTGQKAVLESSQ